MIAYIVDELDTVTVCHLEERLIEAGMASSIEKLFWLPLEESQLSSIQKEHKESCGPYCLALELLEDGVRLELLVRAKGMIRCECIHYAAPEIRHTMMQWLDDQIASIQSDEIEQLFGTCC